MPKKTKAQKAAIERGEAEVERQVKVLSRQPRFATKPSGAGGWVNFWQQSVNQCPDYCAASLKRDSYLRTFWRGEPHMAGVINTVNLIDSNRGWSVTGGRNQVNRYTDIFHDADGGEGWRTYMRKLSLSYWCTDIGAITEIGREGKGGPLRGLQHLDSARCQLTGNFDKPLTYAPAAGGLQTWEAGDFFRVVSLPSDDEALHGLGFCAVSRAYELVRILYAVMVHDQEMLAARAPKGLLLLQGISEEQWTRTLEARAEQLDGLEREYYGGVQVLASMGADQVDAKLIALSQLPQNFDAEKFYALSMYGLALCFGYDPSEFWPVQFGALGRGTETEVQHQKATGKGGTEFALAHQERLQRELPETLHFEYEQRDDAGEMQLEAVKQAKAQTINAMYAGPVGGEGIISRDEARQLAAEAQLIPSEWTLQEEEVTSTDTEDAQNATGEPGSPDEAAQPTPASAEDEQALTTREVQRAMSLWPGAPIVRYTYRNGRGVMRTIWTPRRMFRGHRVNRGGTVYYDEGDVTIDADDIDAAIAAAKKRVPGLADLLEAKPYEAG